MKLLHDFLHEVYTHLMRSPARWWHNRVSVLPNSPDHISWPMSTSLTHLCYSLVQQTDTLKGTVHPKIKILPFIYKQVNKWHIINDKHAKHEQSAHIWIRAEWESPSLFVKRISFAFNKFALRESTIYIISECNNKMWLIQHNVTYQCFFFSTMQFWPGALIFQKIWYMENSIGIFCIFCAPQ